MTETRTLTTVPAVAPDADSPIAQLFDIAREAVTEREEEQREDARLAAVDHLWRSYPDTLAKVVEEDMWNSQSALPGAGLEACAVAYLGGCLWLHHTRRNDQEHHVLTLIAPCTCGSGYVDTALDGEPDLMQLLTELRATSGRFPHTNDGDCDSQQRLRDWDALCS
ncbi:hypothetical protein OG848_47550 (plasmid) [Streptomyces canus]|uniref:hypothetical protein n=1 Tax=Streptomyces canus TaxID=58343 RepID=UPI0032530AEC